MRIINPLLLLFLLLFGGHIQRGHDRQDRVAATAMRLLSRPRIRNAIWPAGLGTCQLVLIWNRPGRSSA